MRMSTASYLVFIVAVPYAAVFLLPSPRWVGRAIASACMVFGLTAGAWWFSLTAKMILPGGKLNQSRKSSESAGVIFRALAVAFALFFTLYITAPFAADVSELIARGQPQRINAAVTAASKALGGAGCFKESVYLRQALVTDIHSYTLLYSCNFLSPGAGYELDVLPRSRVILDFSPMPPQGMSYLRNVGL